MKILMRSDELGKWKCAEPLKAEAEAELQDLLVKSPSLIPVDEIRDGVSPLVFAVSEFGLPGSGNTDILGFSADGDVAIVECKLATNEESKRKVIGQILEYASYLWEMDYEELNNRILKMKNKSLPDLVEEAVAGGWDRRIFQEGVERCLKSGSFILVIVVDKINEELKRIIRYMNECSQSAFSLHALEMDRFRAEGVEILVPHLHGVSSKPRVVGGKRKKWTEEEFFRVLNENVERGVYAIVDDLYKWSKDAADRIWLGTGVETGSFTFHYLKEGKAVSVFSIFTTGKLMLNYGFLSEQMDRGILKEFDVKVRNIPTFKHIPSDFSKWPTVIIAEVFKESGNIEKFKQVVHWLWEAIDGT